MTEPLLPLVFNAALAKKLQALKKDFGAKRVYRGYKGTGGQGHRYQIWVDMPSERCVDLWLEENKISIGGVCRAPLKLVNSVVSHDKTDVDAVYNTVLERLKEAYG